MGRILVLSAEHHAASSLALAYPERSFIFASERSAIDGCDLANVRIVASANGADGLSSGIERTIALCPSRLDRDDLRLSLALPRLGDHAVPTAREPADDNHLWIAKGDLRHRPDEPDVKPGHAFRQSRRTIGDEVVFQPFERTHAPPVEAIGIRAAGGAVIVGLIRVLAERYFREAVLQAGETIADGALIDVSLGALEVLGYIGFFTLHWLSTDSGWRLASFRPVPRAVFGTFRSAGADLLREPRGVTIAAAGHRFVARPHYAPLIAAR